MDITEVKVFPVNEEKLKAYITIVLDNCFVVRDLKIIGGTAGLFVAMPSKRRKDGAFKDIAHPLNQSTRAIMEKKILDAYLCEIKAQGGRTLQTAEQAEQADVSGT
jgi:stage V sporulation protein G